MAVGRYPVRYDRNYLLNGSPAGPVLENFDRWAITTDLTAPATEVMTTVAIPLQAGDVVTSITFKSGGTAADTPLAWWFALYSSATVPALLAQTADQATAAWAANTSKTVALGTPQLITVPGVYYAAFMMKATAVVTLLGRTLALAGASTGSITGQLPLAQTSGSALAATAPATVASPTTSALVPYVVLT